MMRTRPTPRPALGHAALARFAAAAALSSLVLAGCGGNVGKSLGFTKQAPDEFAVVSRAPLSVPPDFSLRPPAPGAVRPQEGSVRDQAKQALVGNAATGIDAAGLTPGQSALLRRAGADAVPADIRAAVNRETSALVEGDKAFTDRIVFWRDPDPEGTVVDAAKEAQRLRDNQALGRPVTEGETPSIERRKKGMLEGLF